MAFAETTIYSGTVTYANTDPITVAYKSCSAGTFDEVNHNWDVSVAGAGSVTLVMTVTNTNLSQGYTINALVTPNVSTDGTIHATWSPATKWIAASGTQDYTLTITSTSATVPQTLDMDISFTR